MIFFQVFLSQLDYLQYTNITKIQMLIIFEIKVIYISILNIFVLQFNLINLLLNYEKYEIAYKINVNLNEMI